jgi:hypothetical protein
MITTTGKITMITHAIDCQLGGGQPLLVACHPWQHLDHRVPLWDNLIHRDHHQKSGLWAISS